MSDGSIYEWLSRAESEELHVGSVIMLGGYLSAQKDGNRNGETNWAVAGFEGDVQLSEVADSAFPALLVYRADPGWLDRARGIALGGGRR